MKLATLTTILGSAAILWATSTFTQTAQAFELTNPIYGIDAVGDGSGASATDMSYDIRGIAMTTIGKDAIVAITANMPLTGNTYNKTNIGWGDLFFNFTGNNFNAAQGNLFGIRFSGTNDSKVSAGVYSNVTAVSVTGQNYGYSSLNQYYTENGGHYNKADTQGSAIATESAAYDYYGKNGPIQNVIGSGTRIGDVAMLSLADLASAGLNFGSNAGSYTFGFKFDSSLLPDGNFLSNLYLECGNDGVALAGTSQSVPEPSPLAGVVLVGAGMIYARRRRQLA
jgi:hypothetical protein